MAEHVLRGEIAIYPRVEGGKQFIVQDLGEIYRVPIPEDALEKVIRDLSMGHEDLMAEIQRREAAKKLITTDGNGSAILRPN